MFNFSQHSESPLGFSFIVFVSLELHIAPVLEIFPHSKIYEGDELFVSCSVKGPPPTDKMHLYLSRGNQLLDRGNTTVSHRGIALAKDIGDFECRLEIGSVVKNDQGTISVTGEWTEES